MKAFSRLATALTGASFLAVLSLSLYNSVSVNNTSFMSAGYDLASNKRLDEVGGELIKGRMTASTIKWSNLKEEVIVEDKKIEKKKVVAQQQVAKQEKELAKPAITQELELGLANVFYKKALKAGSFSGGVKAVDGVIEEVFVNLPNGDTIEINTYDEMVGNVFQYEDAQTREIKSGMFYESGNDKFTIVLTNDARYPGMKLEFNKNGSDIGNSALASNENWAQEDDYAVNDQSYDDERYEDQAYDVTNEYLPEEQQAQQAYGFNFNS